MKKLGAIFLVVSIIIMHISIVFPSLTKYTIVLEILSILCFLSGTWALIIDLTAEETE